MCVCGFFFILFSVFCSSYFLFFLLCVCGGVWVFNCFFFQCVNFLKISFRFFFLSKSCLLVIYMVVVVVALFFFFRFFWGEGFVFFFFCLFFVLFCFVLFCLFFVCLFFCFFVFFGGGACARGFFWVYA